jgi:hypothetical protein
MTEVEKICRNWNTTPDYVRDLKDGTFVMAHRLMYHWMLIRGYIGDAGNYFDRWCYETREGAVDALRDFVECPPAGYEPLGWHRHLPSHRRRPDGDPAKEYIGP